MPKDINILVVDDEEIMRNLFTDILKDSGYKVTTLSTGQEAQETIKREYFDIAFLDVHMPVMNGVQTLCVIKEVSPKTVIVMMDSFPDILLEEAKRQGAFTCIRKPFNISEVREVINKITRKGELNG